jgi:membrane protease YdiL (CAAX protease family)
MEENSIEEELKDREDDEEQYTTEFGVGTQEQMMKDPQWNGVPPVGDRPITDRTKFILFILFVFFVKIVIWSLYRYASGNWSVLQDPVNNYIASLFAKPTLQLIPVILIWQYLFQEKGLPFRFTRKNLFSSIIFGCLIGLLFFFVASGIYVAVFEATGAATNFRFVAGWNDTSWELILAMMFSYMISTGPAEELFSRGFLQDQAARVYKISFAILFSAILFAIGHIPISIFMHRMGIVELGWYMAALIIMGGFFSIIYQWSRNIVFPIIIHGLWDWYLSLFSLKGTYSAAFMLNAEANFGMYDFFITLLTLMIMLPIIYVIYRVWWRYDDPMDGPLGGIVTAIKNFRISNRIHAHDTGSWPRENPIIITAGIVGIFCLLMIPLAGAIGSDNPEDFKDRIIGQGTGEIVISHDNETISNSGNLNEGASSEYTFEGNQMIVEWVNITLTWTDEPDQDPLLNNQPDTFRVTLSDPDGEELDSAEGFNEQLTISWQDSDDIEYDGTFTITVTLVSAGDQEGIFRTSPDNSNNYNIGIDVVRFNEERSEADAGDVRW